MKPKIFLLSCLSFIIFNFSFIIGTVRYVSKTGSSTPPYTTWETAADSIMECINISVFGDTIYVANGTYKEQVVMIPGLSLIGAGMDSCVIDMTDRTTYVNAVEMKDSCLIKGFDIKFSRLLPWIRGVGIHMNFYQDTVKYGIISFNRIDYPDVGMVITEGGINHNIIFHSHCGFECITFDEQREYLASLDSNLISFFDLGIYILENTVVASTGNIFIIESSLDVDGRVLFNDFLSENTSTIFNNNDVQKSTNDLVFDRAISNSFPGSFTNNQFLAKFENVFYTAPVNIYNNNIIGSVNGVYGDTTNVKYNNFWKTQNYPKDSTNISVDPMFVNDTSDFHLQKYSPLIDAGDPNIIDKDGSRSDIGLYGGPYGEQYHYIDLAPSTPVNLNATLDSLTVGITWNKNTEADFNHYNVYRDTLKNFQIDSTNLFLSTPVSNLIDILPDYFDKIYYKLTAVDNQGNESEPSEEVGFILTSITDNQQTISNYQLYQNYPNPFNPSTKISYRLKERGYVKLYVYDIKGELISVLVNQTQEAGFYEVDFVGNGLPTVPNNSDLASGIYIYQIMVKNENNVPVFTDMKKMIYLK